MESHTLVSKQEQLELLKIIGLVLVEILEVLVSEQKRLSSQFGLPIEKL